MKGIIACFIINIIFTVVGIKLRYLNIKDINNMLFFGVCLGIYGGFCFAVGIGWIRLWN